MRIRGLGRVVSGLVGVAMCVMLSWGGAAAQGGVQHVAIGTGSMGGLYYPLGGGVASLITKYVDRVKATAEVTGASLENIQRIHRGEMQLGMTNVDIAYFGFNGMSPFKEKMRILGGFAMYPSVLQVVSVKGKGIKGVPQLKGRTVSVGPPGSNTALMAAAILEAHGLSMRDIRPRYNSIAEAVTALQDNQIDAAFLLAGIPLAAVSELSIRTEVAMIPIEPHVLAKVSAAQPYYVGGVVPRGTYRGQEADVSAVTIGNAIVFEENLDEQLVYDITKAVFDHLDELVAIHKVARFMSAEYATKLPIPLHAGAARYFREKGTLK